MQLFNLKIILFLLLTFVSAASAQNGKILSRKNLDLLHDKQLAERLYRNGQLNPEYSYLNDVIVEKIVYISDGLKISGYLSYPKKGKALPGIIYNRGGNREFGKLNAFKAAFILARLASWGYVVAGSQYRGNDQGEGKEEFGGTDINDVLNLIPLLENNALIDSTRLGIYGWSRGGMMTYLTLMRTCRFKAAAVGGGLSDLDLMMKSRPDTFETVYENNIPNYHLQSQIERDRRSAIKQVNKICKTTPILMLHGANDWRVVPRMALELSQAFLDAKITHRLVMFENGNHGLTQHRREVNRLVRKWFDTYLKSQK